MELKRYLRLVRRHPAVAVVAFLVTSALTMFLVSRQEPTWEATGTAMIKPSMQGTDPDVEDRRNEANDILIRGVKIAETYATVARSELIRDLAERSVPSAIDVSGVSVDAEVVTDTNVLSFTAQGPDPEAAVALGQAVMDATIAHVRELNDAYVMLPLDPAEAGSDPVGPNKGLTIAIGAILGIVLAVVLALFAEYLSGTTEDTDDDVAVDERTGLHTTRYLRTRLREETSRADRTDGAFSLASFGVAVRAGAGWRTLSDRELRKIGELLPMAVPSDVVLAHLGEGEFATLLPETDREGAERLLERWERIVGAVLEGFIADADAIPGFSHSVARYRDGVFDGDREAVRIARKMVGHSTPTVVRGQTSIASAHPVPRTRSEPHGGNGSRGGTVELAPAEETPAARPSPPQPSTASRPRRKQQRAKATRGKPRAATRRR
jgi:capsular polysaccharide biosynthesis protein